MKNNILEGEQFSAHLKKAESVWSQYKFEHEKKLLSIWINCSQTL